MRKFSERVPEAHPDVEDNFQTFIDDLAGFSGPTLDDEARLIYLFACEPLRGLGDLAELRAQIKYAYSFRPTPADVERIAREIAGVEAPKPPLLLTGYDAAARTPAEKIIEQMERHRVGVPVGMLALPPTGESDTRQEARERVAELAETLTQEEQAIGKSIRRQAEREKRRKQGEKDKAFQAELARYLKPGQGSPTHVETPQPGQPLTQEQAQKWQLREPAGQGVVNA